MSSRAEMRRERRKASSGGTGGSSGKLGPILGIVAVAALLIVGWNLFSDFTDPTVRASVPVEYETPQELIEMAQGVSTGNVEAPVTVMEFGDYQCPACQNFFRTAKPFLDVSYIQPGRIEFVFYDFPLEDAHPNAFVAARAARCAGAQDAYWPFHDTLFANQGIWSFEADPVSTFVRYASDLGLDAGTFRSCVRSDQYAELISASQILALQLGAASTPTVIIDAGDGRVIPVPNWSSELRPVLDNLLAEADAEAMSGMDAESAVGAEAEETTQ